MSKKCTRKSSAQAYKERTVTACTPKEQARQYANSLRRHIKEVRLNPFERQGLDADELRLSRRIDAATNTTECYLSVLESHNLITSPDDEDFWLRLNLGMLPGPDRSEHGCSTILAAAVWMLDQLTESGHFDEACRFFPSKDALREELSALPEVHDLCHEEDAILAMYWIILHRNDDCTGLKPRAPSQLTRIYMDDYTTAKKHKQDVPSRRRFEAIFSLIPHACIEEVVESWMYTCHEIMVRLKLSHDIYEAERKRIYQEAQALNKSAYEIMASILDASTDATQNLSVLMQNRSVPQNLIPDTTLGRYTGLVQSRALYDRSNSVEQDMRRVDTRESHLICRIGLSQIMSKEHQEKFFGAETSALWEDLVIHDPYGMCFAFLYLLELGEDLVWAYGVSGNLLDRCRFALPWCQTDAHFNEEASELCDDTEATEELVHSYYGTFISDRYASDDAIRQRYNLAQIVYMETGYILPRTVSGYEDTKTWLNRFGLLETRLGVPALNTISLLHALSARSHIAEPAQIQPQAENVEALQRRIRELEAEKKQLRQERHEAAQEAQNLRKKLTAFESAAADHQRELTELKDRLFSKEHDEDMCAADTSIAFPYRTDRNILVYGGHESWLKEIRKKLPDIRFIKRGMKPDAQMIRNADAVWIQTNALSHKVYDSVTKYATRYKIPIRYFHFASAAKCAEELVLTQRT